MAPVSLEDMGSRLSKYEAWVAQTLGCAGMTAVEVLGGVDQLADGTGGSVDAATGVEIGPCPAHREG